MLEQIARGLAVLPKFPKGVSPCAKLRAYHIVGGWLRQYFSIIKLAQYSGAMMFS
ncbi:hypothetical protein Desgi_0417 [Desulfoscipio gibsoniae DSM 7213]|uniref:Uncharacterized protein n=1 Tax=Desulfoscipio gibsoniae DSM 7213 TaxID=767817 RepID=R4KHI5_9FIRM|nr:hypothetical protein Desgi_0417 [Desulfoscipio gibsoniae DSM 7213]